MITLLSPTKTQSSDIRRNSKLKSNPIALEKAKYLISLLRNLTVDELSKLMKISKSIALKSKDAIDAWGKESDKTQAIYLFQGDAFQKLDAISCNEDDLLFAQDHFIILSALYGYLRPFDFVSTYRLDMNDALKIPDYHNLYDYWTEVVTLNLNALFVKQKNNFILNLASNEYFEMIDRKKLTGEIINVAFKVEKNGDYKTIGIYAKRGRGLLSGYIIKNKIDSPEKIIDFNDEGFQFSKKLSTSDNYVFILRDKK